MKCSLFLVLSSALITALASKAFSSLDESVESPLAMVKVNIQPPSINEPLPQDAWLPLPPGPRRIPLDLFKRIAIMSGNRLALSCTCKTLHEIDWGMKYVLTLPSGFVYTNEWKAITERTMPFPWAHRVVAINLFQLSDMDMHHTGIGVRSEAGIMFLDGSQYYYASKSIEKEELRGAKFSNAYFFGQFVNLKQVFVASKAHCVNGTIVESLKSRGIALTMLPWDLSLDLPKRWREQTQNVFESTYLSHSKVMQFLEFYTNEKDNGVHQIYRNFDAYSFVNYKTINYSNMHLQKRIPTGDRLKNMLDFYSRLTSTEHGRRFKKSVIYGDGFRKVIHYLSDSPSRMLFIEKLIRSKLIDRRINFNYANDLFGQDASDMKRVYACYDRLEKFHTSQVFDALLDFVPEHTMEVSSRVGEGRIYSFDVFMSCAMCLAEYPRAEQLLLFQRFIALLGHFDLGNAMDRFYCSSPDTLDYLPTCPLIHTEFRLYFKSISRQSTEVGLNVIFKRGLATTHQCFLSMDQSEFRQFLTVLHDLNPRINILEEQANVQLVRVIDQMRGFATKEDDSSDQEMMKQKQKCVVQ